MDQHPPIQSHSHTMVREEENHTYWAGSAQYVCVCVCPATGGSRPLLTVNGTPATTPGSDTNRVLGGPGSDTPASTPTELQGMLHPQDQDSTVAAYQEIRLNTAVMADSSSVSSTSHFQSVEERIMRPNPPMGAGAPPPPAEALPPLPLSQPPRPPQQLHSQHRVSLAV